MLLIKLTWTGAFGFVSFPCVHSYLSFSAAGRNLAVLCFEWHHLQLVGAWSVLHSMYRLSLILPSRAYLPLRRRHNKQSALLILCASKLAISVL